VTLLAAPAGAGKTMLLSSWLRAAEALGVVAWVGVERDESDATRFWGMVMDALRGSDAIPPGDPLSTLVPAPLGGQEEFVRRLSDGLGRLSRTVLLVLDDLHHLRSQQALRDVEQLLARAPAQLRTIIVSRHDPKVGLHRRRLAGELTEIRAADLEFSVDETSELMAATGVDVGAGDVARLHERTEGWAAGLRLAAMSLARHDSPERFVAQFSGSERTVAEYLLSEVLATQPPEVRELLLRTCILERVNGPLADLLTGRSDGTRLLYELEEANAFVVALDVGRSWFRYHHLLADLLRLELLREAPEEISGLHRRAAGWLAEHGHVVDAIRHAQRGEDWDLAVDLLGRHWVHLVLDGEDATLAALLGGLPADLADTDAEVATIAAGVRLSEARWTEADALLTAAESALPGVPAARRGRAETALATVSLLRARRLGDIEGVVDEAGRMLHADGAADPELAALALMNLGIAESWTLRLADAETHLERGLALGREIGRPYVEVGCLGGLAVVANLTKRVELAESLLRRAVAVADRVGWSTPPIVAATYVSLGALLIDQGRLVEGEEWLARADPILADAPEPAASVGLRHAQGMLELARGRLPEALAAFREGERLTEQLRAPHFLAAVERQWQLRVELRLGELEPVRAALAERDEGAQWCNLEAHLALAEDEPRRAAEAVAPVLAGDAFAFHENQEIEAMLLDALARTRVEEPEAAERSVERALALAEPQGRVWILLTVEGAKELLEAHPMHRTAHAAHLKRLLDHFAGAQPGPAAEELPEPLSERELAVLRFLPTNLTAGDIANELFLSVHTVKTHMRKLYAKLDVHTRTEAVQRGRALGLLGPARRAD
jgi:LuxR family transcriptional regulator, maltose regulon positive regulatory protein